MTHKKIEPRDIIRLAESLHEMPVVESRAAALAAELDQLNTTARIQSRGLAYDVDALGFSGVLQKLKRPRRQK
jgi:hypothetical protein